MNKKQWAHLATILSDVANLALVGLALNQVLSNAPFPVDLRRRPPRLLRTPCRRVILVEKVTPCRHSPFLNSIASSH